jgi:hypothetical protein
LEMGRSHELLAELTLNGNPISASEVARIMGTRHQPLAGLKLFKY